MRVSLKAAPLCGRIPPDRMSRYVLPTSVLNHFGTPVATIPIGWMVGFEENRDMATTHRRRTTTRRNPGSDLREDVREAIERAWPDGVVEMAFDSDESWFRDVYPKLASAIRRIRGAQLAHEREPEPVPVWFDHSDDDEDPPDDQEPSRSYHLFFVCPEGDAFNYETEIEGIAEPHWEWGRRRE